MARFLFDLIRNYQTERLAAKPLKLLQEYEFYTIKRLERTRILVRVGPMLGLMGTLIPLSPALVGLASGDTTQLADNLVTAFSVTVLGLLIGGIAFVISIVRDRMYSQDISDMEYLLELLEGGAGRLKSGRRRNKRGVWDGDPDVEYEARRDAGEDVPIPGCSRPRDEPLVPSPPAAVAGRRSSPSRPRRWPRRAVLPAASAVDPLAPRPTPPASRSPRRPATPPLTLRRSRHELAAGRRPVRRLGPVDPRPPAGGASATGAGAPPARR